jgi:S-DNA-T family DNA segregation ATPase FtsK/SpoIIIE
MSLRKPLPQPPSETRAAPADSAVKVWSRFQRFIWDIVGVGAVALALMTLLGLLMPQLATGVLLAWWSDVLWLWFGWGSLWVVVVLAIGGLLMLRRNAIARSGGLMHVPWGRVVALELGAFASMAWLAAWGKTSFERADSGLDGGRIGWALSYLFGELLSPLGMSDSIWQMVFLGGLILVCAVLGLGLSGPLADWIERQVIQTQASDEVEQGSGGSVSVAPIQGQPTSGVMDIRKKKRLRLPLEFRQKFQVPADEEDKGEASPPTARDERLPPLDLLVYEQSARPDERTINETAYLIEKTLTEFGIPAKVVGFRVGPTVTQFAVEPGFVEKGSANDNEASRQKVRVSQISALGRDLALALSAERLRIEAPVPGRPYVGIEVPNARSTVVRLRPILESDAFNKINSPLAIALGRDVSGQPVVADLSRMPHLLIAGTTGSGKSVCIAALTACLVMNNTPEDLRLVMIDPKMVELVRFNGLPHLYGRVETDLERILGVLRWTVVEMDRRYRLLEATHSRNLDSYNRKVRRRKGEEPLPHIVVLVDELADLMMSAPDQTEPALVRLAQMARATGIHLVVATQRPSTDVVTGLIKANFPARLSFAVASSVDSRVILDAVGAESLLGHGDMLFMPPEAPSSLRAQGVMVSDQEVERLINYWQKSYSQDLDELPPWEEMLKQEAVLADRDDLIEQAIKIVRDSQRISASLLQRRLRIGYPRAARLIDELEEMGVVGPAQGGGREREVIMGPDDDDPGYKVES